MGSINSINNESDPLNAANVTINSQYTLPNADGAPDQALTTDGGGNVTWETVSSPGCLVWSEITADTNAVVNGAYICNATSAITITLPATFGQGDTIKIVGKNTGGWAVAPNTGDTIYYLDESVGDTGSFSPTNDRGCCEIHGITDNSEWEITEVEDTDFNPVSITGTIAAGYKSSYALGTDGIAKSWGDDALGVLGNNYATGPVSTPITVFGGIRFNKIVAGGGFNSTNNYSGVQGIANDSTGRIWGAVTLAGGLAPRIFASTNLRCSAPTKLGYDYTIIDTDTAAHHALILRSDNTVYAYGYNGVGQLGDNSVVTRSPPTAVVGGHSFTQVTCSGDTSDRGLSGALKADGSVWMWGYNAYGQLGDNSTTSRSSPVSVVGGHSFIQISSGGARETAALKADGTVYCWGYNSNGQLGDNSTTNRSSPVSVVGGHSFIQVSAGGLFVAALKADGTVWTWGQNSSGQLGNNSTTRVSSPVSVVGGYSFIEIHAGTDHMLGLTHDSHVYAWGLNDLGQLGDNSTTNRSSPVSVIGL